MAHIENGPLIAAAHGSIGELTFRQTKLGQVVQKKGYRAGPRKGLDAQTRDRFALAAVAAGLLTAPEGPANMLQADRAKMTKCSYYVGLLYNAGKYGLIPSKYNGDLKHTTAITSVVTSPHAVTITLAGDTASPWDWLHVIELDSTGSSLPDPANPDYLTPLTAGSALLGFGILVKYLLFCLVTETWSDDGLHSNWHVLQVA